MKALIVDDEFSARKIIESIIDWTAYDFEPPTLAGNGKEALELCQKNKFDLIFADIEMPILNGLQLIEALKERQYEAKIIMISCHESFDYAKAAIRLGVNDYILKDMVTKEDVLAILAAMQKQESQQKKIQLQSCNAAFAIAVDDYYTDYYTSWINTLKNSIPHTGGKVLDSILVLTIPVKRSNSSSDFIGNTFVAANQIRKTANSLGCKNVSIGIGEDAQSESQAIMALKSRIFNGMKRNIIYSQSCDGVMGDVERVENLILTIKQLALNGDCECFKYIDQLFELSSISGFSKVNFYDYLFLKLCSHAFYIASKYDKTFFIVEKDSDMSEEQMHQAIYKIYDELININRERSVRPIIQKALDIIEQNYKSDLSLNNLSELLFVHKGYLCRAFKEDIGENIMQYIVKRKLKEAKRMLHSNNYKLLEISEKLGFASPQYFSCVFKKNVGMTPNEFKKKQ